MDFYRKTDRLAVTKLVSKLTRSSLKSPYAACMLIRIACKLIEEEDATGQLISKEIFFDFNCSKQINDFFYKICPDLLYMKVGKSQVFSICPHPQKKERNHYP